MAEDKKRHKVASEKGPTTYSKIEAFINKTKKSYLCIDRYHSCNLNNMAI